MAVIDIEGAEDYYLAAEVLKRVRKGEERIFSAEEVREDLGLDEAPLPSR